jgi:hypothetical protein
LLDPESHGYYQGREQRQRETGRKRTMDMAMERKRERGKNCGMQKEGRKEEKAFQSQSSAPQEGERLMARRRFTKSSKTSA